MFATLNETNKVIGYSIEPWMKAIALTDDEYMRQISSNGYFIHLGNGVFEERAFEAPKPTETEMIEADLGRRYAEEQEAIREVAKMQAVAMVPELTAKQLFKIRHVFPQWANLVGSTILKAETPYIMHGNDFYMINQDHTAQSDWVPGEGTESLYRNVAEPGTIAPWVQPLGGHDVYNSYGSGLPKSDPVTHKGKTWISTVNANSWEPGVYGWSVFIG